MAQQMPSEKKTFSDVLEETVTYRGDAPIRPNDAAAITAAELRAAGKPGPPDGLGARAREAAEQNLESGAVIRTREGWKYANPEEKEVHTIGEVLQNVKEDLPGDRPVDQRAAHFIQQMEAHTVPPGSNPSDIVRGGVGARADSSATKNLNQ